MATVMIILTETSHIQKDKYHLFFLICEFYKISKKLEKKFIRKMELEREGEVLGRVLGG